MKKRYFIKALGVAVAAGIVAAMLVPTTAVLASHLVAVNIGGPATVNPGQISNNFNPVRT